MKHSVELEDSALGSKEPDLKLSEDVKLTHTQGQSMQKTLELSQMETSEQFNLFQPILSVADSPARTYPMLMRKEKDLKESDLVFGGSLQGSLKIAHLVGSSWKTFQHSFSKKMEWETFSGSFPRSGSMLNGIVYQHQPLVPLTKEIGSLSYVGTPKKVQSLPSKKFSHGRKPTPPMIAKSIGGKLNPQWVEWLMGFPIDYTAMNALGMQLYRKFLSGLRTESKKLKVSE